MRFKKITSHGVFLGCLISSFELRGYFESIASGTVSRNNLPYPLLTHPFLDYIESHDVKEFNLIEFGSGNSTLFFEKIFNEIISFETNLEWFKKVQSKIKKTKYNFIENNDLESGKYVIDKKILNKSFVLVDAACNRLNLVRNFISKYKPPFFILDNSEWYRNTSTLIVENGYFEVPFWGYKNSEHWESCTSLFININDVRILKRNSSSPPPLSRKMNNKWDV